MKGCDFSRSCWTQT